MYTLFHKIQKKAKNQSIFAVGIPALIWQSIFFYLPLFLVLITSVIKLSDDGVFQGLTFQNFTPLFSRVHFGIIFGSLSTALLSALLCLLIAFPLAHFIAFQGKRYKTFLLFLLIVPFWTNFLLHVYAWFFVLERDGFLNNLLLSLHLITEPIHFLNSFFAIVLMMVYCYLPFMVLPIFSSLERFDRHLIDVSSNLGASYLQTLRNIILPLTLPAIRTGFFLVFIPAFGEFIIPEFMGGDKRYFVGNVVSQYFLGDDTGELGAAFMILCCISLILSTVGIYILFKKITKSLARGVK